MKENMYPQLEIDLRKLESNVREIVRRCDEDASILSRSCMILLISFCRFAIVVMPIIAFIGVRISWLIFDKNSLFAMLEASAFSLIST